jgi:diaminopimelate epimerase
MSSRGFEKFEGLGNDFIVIEAEEDQLTPQDAIAWCDRHRGIGADGVLLVGTPRSSASETLGKMVVLNADGSRPEMCGNGLRCVAQYLARKWERHDQAFWVETDAGLKHCLVQDSMVQINMGTARSDGNVVLELDGQHITWQCINTGNPHAVLFRETDDVTFERWGPLVSKHVVFPEGTNAEFATILADNSIQLRVWERGVGPTLACGTGACATVVVACLSGVQPYGKEVLVHLPGGDLYISVDEELNIQMRGPARCVFRGTIDL